MSRNLLLVALSMFMWGIGESIFLYFQPIYLEEMGATPLQIGAILSILGILLALAHIPAGYLSDRVGSRPLLWLSWTVGMLATWIMALARTLPLFVGGYLLYNLTAFVMAPLNSYATAARGRLSVGHAITLISASYNAGAILGPLLGGQIGEGLGLRSIYLVSACLFVLSTIVIYLIEAQPLETPCSRQASLRLTLQRPFILFLGVVFIANLAMYLPQPLSQNFLQNERLLNLKQIGELGSMASLGIVALNLLLGQLETRPGFILGQAATVVFALALWQGRGLGWYRLGYFFLGGYRAARSLAAAHTRTLVPPAAMGLAYGVNETVGAGAIILAPLLAGWVYQRNPEEVYPLSLGLMLVSIIISIIFSPKSHSHDKLSANPTHSEVE